MQFKSIERRRRKPELQNVVKALRKACQDVCGMDCEQLRMHARER